MKRVASGWGFKLARSTFWARRRHGPGRRAAECTTFPEIALVLSCSLPSWPCKNYLLRWGMTRRAAECTMQKLIFTRPSAGGFRESNSGPLAPEASIMPLNQIPALKTENFYGINSLYHVHQATSCFIRSKLNIALNQIRALNVVVTLF